MEVNKEVHPLVTLLLERMKSHPEEFEDHFCGEPEMPVASTRDRWGYAINEIQRHGSDADNEALVEGLRPLRLDKAHQWALDELLNGEERRAEERRKQEEREKQFRALAIAQATTIYPTGQQLQGYANINATSASTYPTNKKETSSSLFGSLLGKLKP